MLQIRLKRDPSSEGVGAGKPLPAETVTVACPDHLVLADLPVGKGLGIASSTSVVKVVGQKSRRQLGERVHFCVRCDFPIAIYGRLSPCDHAFCLDCARSDSICYLCDERIQKIQIIKMMEGIFICAAPHCLKSFMKKTEFESHILETHSDLVHPNAEKDDGNESEARSIKQSSTVSESTARGPSRPPVFSPHNDCSEDKSRHGQRPMMMHQKPTPEAPFPEFPPLLHQIPQPFLMPLPTNPMLTPPLPFGFPPFQPEGPPPFYGGPYEMARQDSGSETGPEQGSLLGFPPSGMNFTGNYPQPWNATGGGLFEPPPSIGKGPGEPWNPGALPLSAPPPLPSKGSLLPVPGSGPMDLGVLAPPPPATSHMPQMNRGNFYQGDGHGFGWQHENNQD